MLIKPGVDISRLKREIRRALPICDDILQSLSLDFVVTSTFEGTHSPGSLHYSNDAFDFRLNRSQIIFPIDDLILKVGNDFDVVMKVDHIHIEYDP